MLKVNNLSTLTRYQSLFYLANGIPSAYQPDPQTDSRPVILHQAFTRYRHGRCTAFWLHLYPTVFHLKQYLVSLSLGSLFPSNVSFERENNEFGGKLCLFVENNKKVLQNLMRGWEEGEIQSCDLYFCVWNLYTTSRIMEGEETPSAGKKIINLEG